MSKRTGSVHVTTTRRHYKGKVYETTLLRRSYREGGKVRNETVGNLSHLPPEVIAAIRAMLAGRRLFDADSELAVTSSLPHGHVAAVLAVARSLGLERLLSRERSRERDLALAMTCQLIISPGSKLSLTRRFSQTTSRPSLRLARSPRLSCLTPWTGSSLARGASRPPSLLAISRRRVRALRPLVFVCRGPALPAGRARPLARRQERQAAGQLGHDLLCRGPSRGDRRAPRQHGRPRDPAARSSA